MHLFYAVLAFVMALNNGLKGIRSGSIMHFVMAAMWLAIGIVFTVKHFKAKKNAKKKREQNKEV